jgi:hypothetical protein
MRTVKSALVSLLALALASCADDAALEPLDDGTGDNDVAGQVGGAGPDAGEAYWRTLGDAAVVDPATVPHLLDAPPPACAGKFALPGDPESGYRIAQWGTCSFLCETYRGAYAQRRRVSDLRGVCAALGGVCAGAVADALCIPAP